jgi:hypothetical protein
MDKTILSEFDRAPKEHATPPPPLSYDDSSSEDDDYEDPEDAKDEADLCAAHAFSLFAHVMVEIPADYVPDLAHMPDLDREREISVHFNDATWWETTNPDTLPPPLKRSRRTMDNK